MMKVNEGTLWLSIFGGFVLGAMCSNLFIDPKFSTEVPVKPHTHFDGMWQGCEINIMSACRPVAREHDLGSCGNP